MLNTILFHKGGSNALVFRSPINNKSPKDPMMTYDLLPDEVYYFLYYGI